MKKLLFLLLLAGSSALAFWENGFYRLSELTYTEVVSAPAASKSKVLNPGDFSIHNPNTNSIVSTVFVRFAKGTNDVPVWRVTLEPGDTFISPRRIVLDDTDETIEVYLDVTNQFPMSVIHNFRLEDQ